MPVRRDWAGPLVGVCNDAVIVAGGANFSEPVWESDKLWRDEAGFLSRAERAATNGSPASSWIVRLPTPRASALRTASRAWAEPMDRQSSTVASCCDVTRSCGG
jgi:hypothetical protein